MLETWKPANKAAAVEFSSCSAEKGARRTGPQQYVILQLFYAATPTFIKKARNPTLILCLTTVFVPIP
jgi:hypothetical protein